MSAGALAGAGIVSNIVGGIAGAEAGRADAGEARNAMNLAFEELNRIGLPPDLSKKIIYEQFKQVGILTPELEKDILAGPSKIAQIEEAKEPREAQMEALRILQERGKGGLSPEDRAALSQIRGEMARDAESKRQQILQSFQTRGQGGSGAELIASLQASQAAANLGSQQGEQLAALASQRALESIGAAGTLGGQLRSQDFGIAREKAAAEEAIERFNIANRLGTQQRNVGARNIAQERNLSEAQRIAEANIQQENLERLRQTEASRQKWLDEMNRQQVLAGGQMARSEYLQGQSERAAARGAAPFQAIGAGLTSFGNYKAGQDERAAQRSHERDLAQMNYFSQRPTSSMNASFSPFERVWQGGKIPEYAEGGEVKGFLSSVRDAFGNDDSVEKMKKEDEQDKYEKIRVQNRANFGYNEGGEVKLSFLDKFKDYFSDSESPYEKLAKTPVSPEEFSKGVRKETQSYYHGGNIKDYREGGKVEGKAPIPGDHPANDIVPAMLSPGEIVIPRSIAKTDLGKKLNKLLEDYHNIRKEMKD